MKVTCTDFHDKERVVDATQLIDRSSVYGIYINNGKVLLIQDPRSLRWELPGGGVEHDETPKQSLVREFIEETGVTPIGPFTFLKKWEEYFFDVVGQQAWRSKRIFYRVEKISHLEELLAHGNNEDSARVELMPITNIAALHIAPKIRKLIKECSPTSLPRF